MLTSTSGGGNLQMILILVVFFLNMYFIMIRPEKKKQKKIEAMRNALTVGDDIVSIGGIMGVVVNVTEDTITIETAEDKVRVNFK